MEQKTSMAAQEEREQLIRRICQILQNANAEQLKTVLLFVSPLER